MKLNGSAANMCSNPLYCYIAISFKNGKVELLETNPNLNSLNYITKLVLCDEEISSVNFFSDGKLSIMSSFPTGRLYLVSVSEQ